MLGYVFTTNFVELRAWYETASFPIFGFRITWVYVFGFVLCLLRVRTGSLYPGIVLHSANNSLAFGISQHWSSQIAVLFAGALVAIALAALAVDRWWARAGGRPRVAA